MTRPTAIVSPLRRELRPLLGMVATATTATAAAGRPGGAGDTGDAGNTRRYRFTSGRLGGEPVVLLAT
ncbi:MAG: hypothetical protein M3O15_05280, partial [Acidobacteriota bacterium]|nr:hypothetical protein [Acidobacteriota bacterium]